jgi:hypothetical protein
MTSRICVCCGERFSIEINTLSRNSNICASCSSMADGMEESNLPDAAEPRPSPTPAAEPKVSEISVTRETEKKAEPTTHRAF